MFFNLILLQEVNYIPKKGVKFCIECGKENISIIENRCRDCYLSSFPLIKQKTDKLAIKICKECFNYYHRRWIKPRETEFNNFLNEILEERIDTFIQAQEDVVVSFDFDITARLFWTNRKFDLYVKGEKYFPEFGENLITNLTLSIKVMFTYCDSCLKLRSGSYNAIVNITRAKQFNESEINYFFKTIEKKVEKMQSQDRMAFLAKYTIDKRKVKLCFGSEKIAKTVAESFLNQLGGISREHTTMTPKSYSKGKKHDKLIINLKLPPFTIGDVISIDDVPYLIKSVNKDIINIYNLPELKNQIISLKDKIDFRILKARDELEKFTVVSIYDDIIQIMNERTYQTYEILKKDELLNINIQDKLTGLVYNNQVFIIPKNDE
ncbi:MAG: hypothetical protein GF329_03095 [Candidatus Lokiarchaeota archaeon]|nr:hypothetical protein [Candidatus Lokiarchaeota archaeon]